MFEVRTVRFPEEFPLVKDLWAGAGSGIQLRASDEIDEMKKKLLRDPDLFLAAFKGEEIAGAVLGGYDGRRGMVYHLAVAGPFRRQGVGRLLMEELEKRFRAKGCIKYYLLVTKNNHEALDFYQAFGCDIMNLHVLGKELP